MSEDGEEVGVHHQQKYNIANSRECGAEGVACCQQKKLHCIETESGTQQDIECGSASINVPSRHIAVFGREQNLTTDIL